MKTSMLYGANALLVTFGIALATPGCFTVGDDDSGDAGSSGEGGESGKGTSGKGGSSSGSGGSSSGSGGSSSGSGGTGGMCIATGETCASNGECCSFEDPVMGFCVGGVCADGCNVNADCQSHCCAGLQSGGNACGPSELCCVDDYEPCEANYDCCSYLSGAGYCISDTGACQPLCTDASDCATNCCLPIDAETGESVCAPSEYCATSP